MILLWGIDADTPLAAVRRALGKRREPSFFLDQARSRETRIELSGGHDIAGEIRIGDSRCDLSRISGVYVRSYGSRAVTPGAEDSEEIGRHADRVDEIVCGFLEVTAAHVVNPTQAAATNSSKPYQAAIIAAHGFGVPATLISTDPAAVVSFHERYGQIVYKSVSSVRSIVSRFSPEQAARIADVEWCPTQFQEYVPGRDYRVHVVGSDVFASEIVSEADDYRYAARTGHVAEVCEARIPVVIEERCIALASALGLPFAGVDLRLTPEGAWYCFEVNPSPAFTYYQSATGQPIAEAVASLLSSR